MPERRRETEKELDQRIDALECEIASDDPERLEELMYLRDNDDGGWDEDEEDYWRNNLRDETEEELVDAWDQKYARIISKLAREIVRLEMKQETRVSGNREE